MDVLKYKTVTAVDGAVSVSTGGLNLNQIIKVSRQGEQKDWAGFVSISSLNGNQWVYLSVPKKITFGTSFPFIGAEKIYIMYKETI